MEFLPKATVTQKKADNMKITVRVEPQRETSDTTRIIYGLNDERSLHSLRFLDCQILPRETSEDQAVLSEVLAHITPSFPKAKPTSPNNHTSQTAKTIQKDRLRGLRHQRILSLYNLRETLVFHSLNRRA